MVRFCSMRAKEAVPYSLWGGAQPSDIPYSELVLLRQDSELDAGYEIVRGDEAACWTQLLTAVESHPLQDIAVAGVSWLNG